jgi:hypothetical protein
MTANKSFSRHFRQPSSDSSNLQFNLYFMLYIRGYKSPSAKQFSEGLANPSGEEFSDFLSKNHH